MRELTFDERRVIRMEALPLFGCNGEQVAGFKDLETGHFEEIALIRSEADLDGFRKEYGITGDIEKEY